MNDDPLSKAVDDELPGLQRQQAALRDALNTRTLNTRRKKALNSVGTVLNQVVSKLGLDRRLREHTLMSLWPVIIGDMFAARSRALFIDHEGNFVVAVKDASVGQELSLLKPEILRKLRSTATSVGVKVNGLRFDMKHFHNKPPPSIHDLELGRHKRSPDPSESELNELALTCEEQQEIEQLKIRLTEASNAGESQEHGGKTLSQRMLGMFERELRLRKWRRQAGFPICPACNEPAVSFHGRAAQCADCYFESHTGRDI